MSCPLCIRIFITGVVLAGPGLIASQIEADRLAMMADAHRAREAGDFSSAEVLLSDLLKLAPHDRDLRALLESVRNEIESAPPAPAQPLEDLDQLVEAESERLQTRHRKNSEVEGAGGSVEDQAADLATDQGAQGQDRLSVLLTKARAQLRAGDLEGARMSCIEAELRDSSNAEVKRLQTEIARQAREISELDRLETRERMLDEVARSWQRPQVFDRDFTAHAMVEDRGLQEKLREIMVPRVSFSGVPLSRVIDTLSALSEEYDKAGVGVNMVLIDPSRRDPQVSINLRGLSLSRVIDFIVESVGFEYDVQSDAVVVRQGQGPTTRLETEFFPISRSTIIRLTGLGAAEERSGSGLSDPFAPASTSAGVSIPVSEEEVALRNFLQRAGVPFDSVEGGNLALADGQLIVTQTPRNMERVRNILRRYSEVKQVEIETRFLEVQQGALEELGFNWSVATGGYPLFDPNTGNPVIGADGKHRRGHRNQITTQGRQLSDPLTVSGIDSAVSVILPDAVDGGGAVGSTGRELIFPQGAPVLPNHVDLGSAAGNLARLSGVIGTAQVDLIIRALERETGNDLMSAPKVTVLSGKTAHITVAQELRYPSSYDRVDAQVGRGDSAAGSAGVAITAGTPQHFTMRNVGVEMEVTPTVEDDNAISLLLEPRVTEFEGFVEYGGTSVAIASNTTVTVPSGFYQPIFSVRRVRTEVTIWDGATVVMGGLTREQAVSIHDKVPILGDIPLLGRLFRSVGESTQKRNLLIFVSANLISPGGSPARQRLGASDAGSLFQNPVFVTPGGAVTREPVEAR